MLIEQGKYYVIIRAVPGKEVYEEEIDYLYGRKLVDRQDKVLQGFSHQKHSVGKEQRRKELWQEKARIQEVLNRMDIGRRF